MLKLNLGSGPVRGSDGWLNLDREVGADLQADLTQGLPFQADTVAKIYTSHFLEHLSHPEICGLLLECYRVLVPGGEISVCVPDFRKFIDAYVSGDYASVTLSDGSMLSMPSFLLDPSERIYRKALVNTGSPIDWLNYIAYSNSEHRYVFDQDNLLSHLGIAGFRDCELRDFDPVLDYEYGRMASVYAVGIK